MLACHSRRTSIVHRTNTRWSSSSRREHHKSERSPFIRGREREKERKREKRVASRLQRYRKRRPAMYRSTANSLEDTRAGCRLWELMGRRRHSLLLRISLILTELALASTSATPVLFLFPAPHSPGSTNLFPDSAS